MSLFDRCASRNALLLSASALAIFTAAPALAQTTGAGSPGAGTTIKVPSVGVLPGPAVQPAIASTGTLNRPLISAGGNITPAWGDIDAFWGDINPFWGDIDAFWGDINPFWGDIDAFWGDIDAFWGDIDAFWGDINPFWGDIDAFWGDIDAFHGGSANAPAYGDIGVFWADVGPTLNTLNAKWGALGAYTAGSASYAEVQTALNKLVTDSGEMWGAAVTAKTGKTFRAGFADPLLAKYGINLDDPSTLAGMTAAKRGQFLVEWYDGLMGFSGVDHVDHWMSAVRWSPTLTQIQGEGADTTIGLLDMTVAGDADIANNITAALGYSNSLTGHGTGVASLMVAAHDGEGLMGIAPAAKVVAYNPFDGSGTASWADVRSGIAALRSNGASVINMSLGVSGWTLHGDWKDALATYAANTVFVIAGGNAGVAQAANIDWNWTENPAIIVVGSVDPDLQISDFSNKPGAACLMDNGACTTGHRLMDSFIVAPGELILVSDGQGGVTRRSGTSFAAPLVTGAVALLHDRWPWLTQHPHETVDIILKSARDLGAPGTDPVYGRGMLDIEASQSPLNFNDLTFYEYKNGVMTQKTAAQVKSGGVNTTWEADGVYFKLFEPIGGTYRDFSAPMSSRLVGQKSNVTGSQEYFQSYLNQRMGDWIGGSASFTDVVARVSQAPGQWSFAVSTALPPPPLGRDELASQAPHMSVRMADPAGRFAFSFGHGEGAMVLGEVAGFGQTRDYKSADGGVNPLLGFASGGAFANAEMTLARNTTLSFGAAERTLVHRYNTSLTDAERDMLRNVDDYRSSAVNLRLTQRLSDAVTLSAGYSRLSEANGLLGVQSTDVEDLGRGSVSDAMTVGASFALPRDITVAASATLGQTRTDGGQNLASVGAVKTSAYAVSFTKRGVTGKDDLVRFAFTQPLTIDSGKLAFSSVDVIDRKTGEIGVVTQTFDISVKPRHVAEALYAAPAFDGKGQVSVFGRAEFTADDPAPDYMAGVRLNFNY
jgi:hypothetical protein